MDRTEFATSLRRQGLDLSHVTPHRNADDVLCVYLAWSSSEQASDVAASVVSEMPGVTAVTPTIAAHQILLVRFESTAPSD
jgi:hypothetical protein